MLEKFEEKEFKNNFRKKFPINTIISIDGEKELIIKHKEDSFVLIDLEEIRNNDFSAQMIFEYNSKKAFNLYKNGIIEEPNKLLFYLGSNNKFIVEAFKRFSGEGKNSRKN